MKHLYQILLSAILLFSAVITYGNILMEEDSVSMGAGYANDVYYSLENGEVHSANRTNWDLGFYTNSYSDCIITNDGNGVTLYTYGNSDISGWNSIDTTGLSEWNALYNSMDEWEVGAFNRHAKGHPDYGWGIYNPVTHNIVGDSLYIVMFSDGSAKKLWMEKKHSEVSTFYFKYADLDGANEVSEIVNCTDYDDKNFLYYSMETQEVIDREPASDTWDILFTKYIDMVSNGSTLSPYPVTGVLNNIDVTANKFAPVDLSFEAWYDLPLESTKAPIGYDWKYLEGWSFLIEDSTVSFVKGLTGNINKIVFTGFDGSSTGNIYFSNNLISLVSINENTNNINFGLFPNPANKFVTINIDDEASWDKVIISDLTGKTVISQEVNQTTLTLNLDKLQAGMYLVSLQSEKNTTTRKLIIRNN